MKRTSPFAPVLAALLCAIALVGGPSSRTVAAPERFSLLGGEDGSLIIFISKAPMETIEGRTRAVSGFVEADLSDLSAPIELRVEIDLEDFDTGNKLRNKHMRENHLETERFPRATFTAARLVDPPAGGPLPGETLSCRIAGTLDLHGVAREIELPLTLALEEMDGERHLHVRGEFSIALANHDIARPRFLLLKLSESQRVLLDIVAVSGPRAKED